MQAVGSSAESHQSHTRSQRSGGSVLVFFSLTFITTWALWALSSRLAGFAANTVFLSGVFAPGLIALALTLRRSGVEGARSLLHRIVCWNVGLRWYLFAIFYIPAIKLFAALVSRVISGTWPQFGAESVLVMFAALLVSTWVQAGEEVGWRGYALPRLSDRVGLGPASIVLGIAWATWHLPLFFYFSGDTRGQSFLLYLLQVVAISVTMGWLYWKTSGSLLLVMLFHAAVNNLKDIVPSAQPGTRNPLSLSGSIVGWTTLLLLWIFAAVFLMQMRRVRHPDAA